MIKKRVHRYDSFQNKIEEGIHEPGFIKEFEDEIDTDTVEETDLDSKGEGEKVTDSESASDSTDDIDLDVDVDATIDEQPDEQPIDTGNREDISFDEVKVKMGFINDQLKSFNNLVKNADNVPLDKTTKEKIVKIYSMLQ